MPQQLNFRIEAWDTSPVVRHVGEGYERWPAARYNDAPAQLKPRQAAFYRNLIAMALAHGSGRLPVDFFCNGVHVYLDHGCIKIAEHAGFINPLVNGPAGVVETIELSWAVAP
jgi:hypothetical protein